MTLTWSVLKRSSDFGLVTSKLSPCNTEWKFNQLSGPWMGRVWVSLIKQVKRSLKSVTNHQVFTKETLVTILCEIKSILNQQPLTAISDDCQDFEVLTPSHFLIGAYSPNLLPGVFSNSEINHKKRWRNVQAVVNIFWSHWCKEYLLSLQNCQKWFKRQQNLQQGDLVLVVNDNEIRSHWPVTGVLQVYPGQDGVVRSAKVKLPNTEMVHPSQKLFP